MNLDFPLDNNNNNNIPSENPQLLQDLQAPQINNNRSQESIAAWKRMLGVKDRIQFEKYFEIGQCWGTLIETIRFGIQLYATRFRRGLYFKSVTSDGLLVRCSDCSVGLDDGFRLRFYKHADCQWRVSAFREHATGCRGLEEGAKSYFMKPLELATLIKNHSSTLPTTGVEIQEILKEFELFPYYYRNQAVYNLTHNILQYLQGSALPQVTLESPSIVPLSFRKPRKKTHSLAFPALVLRGLSSFVGDFLHHDSDNRIFIERSADGVYQRCTMILGPVVRLSRTYSTGQFDIDGTYFKKINIKTGKHRSSAPSAGFLKAVCYSDGNNCYYPIAVQHDTCEESKHGYKHLLECLWTSFPHTLSSGNCYCSDRDSGLLGYLKDRRDAGLPTPDFVYCSFHLKMNVLAKYVGKDKKAVRTRALKMFQKITYCKRKDQTEKRLELLKTKMKDLFDYLTQIGPKNFCDSLMTSNRPEKLTSNSVESLWAHVQDIRAEMRVPLFFRDIYNFTINKLLSVEKEMLARTDYFTPYAHSHMIQRNNWAKQKGMELASVYTEGSMTGTLRDGRGRLSSVSLQPTTMSCTCQARLIQRIPCACLMRFLVLTRNERLLTTRIHPSYLLSSWKAALESSLLRPQNSPSPSLSSSSSSSTTNSSSALFSRIFLMQWKLPVTESPETFGIPAEFGASAGRKPKAAQSREMGIRPTQGTKPTFFQEIAEQDESDADSQDTSPSSDEQLLVSNNPPVRYFSDELHDEESRDDFLNTYSSDELFDEDSEDFVDEILTQSTSSLSSSTSPQTSLQSAIQPIVSLQLPQQSPMPSPSSLQSSQAMAGSTISIDSVQLQDVPRTNEQYHGGRFVNYLHSSGSYKRLESSCTKCRRGIVSIKFRRLVRWDVYGICSACNACYKKVHARTNHTTHLTCFRFELEEDQRFLDSLPESITGLSDSDDLHPHAGNRRSNRAPKPRNAETSARRERMSSQGDPRDQRNSGLYDTGSAGQSTRNIRPRRH